MCAYIYANSRCLSCVGGRQGKLPVASFEVYDFQTSRWRSLPDIPSKRVFALYAHSDSHVFSVGGLQQDGQPTFTDVTEVFDLDTGASWSSRLFFDCIITTRSELYRALFGTVCDFVVCV